MSIFWFLWGVAAGYALEFFLVGEKRPNKRFWWYHSSTSRESDADLLILIACFVVVVVSGGVTLFGWPEKTLSHLFGVGTYFGVIYSLVERPERQKWLRDLVIDKVWPWLKMRPKSISERVGGWWKSWRGRRAIERERSGTDIQASFNALAAQRLHEIGEIGLLNLLKARIKTVVGLELPPLLERRKLLLEEIPRVEDLLAAVTRPEDEKTKEAERTRGILKRMGGELQKVETTLGDLRRSLHFVPAVVSETKLGLLSADSTSQKAIEDLDRVVAAIHESVEAEMLPAVLPETSPPALTDGAGAPAEVEENHERSTTGGIKKVQA